MVDDSLLKTGGLPDLNGKAPVILIRGKWVEKRIKGLLDTWIKRFPQEVQEFGNHCQMLRDNAQFKGRFTNVVYNDKTESWGYELKIHWRIYEGMVNLFNPQWMDDPEIMDRFLLLFPIGQITKDGRPGPNEPRAGRGTKEKW